MLVYSDNLLSICGFSRRYDHTYSPIYIAMLLPLQEVNNPNGFWRDAMAMFVAPINSMQNQKHIKESIMIKYSCLFLTAWSVYL